jgi:hypothetical protein
MVNQRLKHVMIGLPDTGKTTFLAAFWHVIKNAESVPGALQLAGIKGDRTYLNKIEQQWMACLPLERTKIAWQAVTIQVREPVSGEAVELSIPDISGELYEVFQWGKRECPRSYAALAATAAGAIFFVHPHATKETDPITEVDRALAGLTDDCHAASRETSQTKAEPWDPKRVPTQIKLVELLQFFLSHTSAPVRLAVVVSAWDCVTERGMTPDRWLETRIPLVHQFLAANDDRFTHCVYGVSAQGGPLEKAEQLREESKAVRRIRVVGVEGESNDITAPVRWLMATERTQS